MKIDHRGLIKNTWTNWLELIAYVWLFVSVVAGVVHLAQYLYAHLQWVV